MTSERSEPPTPASSFVREMLARVYPALEPELTHRSSELFVGEAEAEGIHDTILGSSSGLNSDSTSGSDSSIDSSTTSTASASPIAPPNTSLSDQMDITHSSQGQIYTQDGDLVHFPSLGSNMYADQSVILHSGDTLNGELNELQQRLGKLDHSRHGFIRDSTQSPQSTQTPLSLLRSPDCEPPSISHRFKALFRRSIEVNDLVSAFAATDFYPDMCFTPFEVAQGVYKVVQTNPLLRLPQVRRAWTLISHGVVSHEWSLVPDVPGLVVRPIATYETPTGHLGEQRAVINDLAVPELARSVSLVLFSDAYTQGHVEFAVCEDYVYGWHYDSNHKEYYLVQHREADGMERVAARVSTQGALFRNPVNDSTLWSFEVDIDRISPAVGFLSAFMLMQHQPLLALHSMLSFHPEVHPPQPLVDAAFEDEGRIFQRSSKFYSDWEEEAAAAAVPALIDARPPIIKKIRLIRVFHSVYLGRFALPDSVIHALDEEASAEVERLRAHFGLPQ